MSDTTTILKFTMKDGRDLEVRVGLFDHDTKIGVAWKFKDEEKRDAIAIDPYKVKT